jgi:glycosyltransferase involved in cell wall biosynthesis
MKIMMVIDSLDKGGKERRMLELIKGLKNRNNDFEIYLISLSDRIEYEYVYDLPIQFEVIKRKFKKDLSIPFKLKRIISTFKPDIIHSWSTMASVYLSFSNLFTGIPLINAVLADAPVGLNISDKHFLRVKLTTPFSDLFISNSKAGIVAYNTPRYKSVCIYNGIDFGRFENLRPEKEMRSEILGYGSENKFVISMVASFDERKDFGTLVNAAVKLCSNGTSFVFLLIGAGPLLEKLKSSVPGKFLQNKQIIFAGKRNDVESVLQIVDVGVLMTNAKNHGEGVSNSIIECMASGKPVIASSGGGTDEVIVNGFNGYLIDPGNEEQLMEKIEKLYNDRTLLKTLGMNAGAYARDRFELENKTTEYITLYRNLIHKTEKQPGA